MCSWELLSVAVMVKEPEIVTELSEELVKVNLPSFSWTELTTVLKLSDIVTVTLPAPAMELIAATASSISVSLRTSKVALPLFVTVPSMAPSATIVPLFVNV